jgi:hypothetical protein
MRRTTKQEVWQRARQYPDLAEFVRLMRRFEPDAVLVDDGDPVYWMEERCDQNATTEA